jgi:anaerobic ribonucleoside-triphosphate reductase activating protein
MNSLRVVNILEGTTVDGPGFRTSIYFAGCDHHCPGCHNPSTWDHEAGSDMSIAEIMERINDADCNVTFSGGDPMLQAEALLPLAEAIRRQGKTIWCYTGYTYEQVQHDKSMSRLLPYLEVLVDGPFIESLRDTSLLFRGSSNQRLIDIDRSKEGEISLWVSAF